MQKRSTSILNDRSEKQNFADPVLHLSLFWYSGDFNCLSAFSTGQPGSPGRQDSPLTLPRQDGDFPGRGSAGAGALSGERR